MTLTNEERTSWMYRLENRIDRAVRSLCRDDPGRRLGTVKQQARIAAAEELGIRYLLDERDEILAQGARLQMQEKSLRRQMQAIVSGENREEVTVGDHPSLPAEVIDALEKVSKKHLRTMLQESDTGRTILSLKRARRELEDTVMLAGSEQDLQGLWASVLEQIGQTLPTGEDDPLKTSGTDESQ